MSEISTIRAHKSTKDALKSLQNYPKEPEESIINRLIAKARGV